MYQFLTTYIDWDLYQRPYCHDTSLELNVFLSEINEWTKYDNKSEVKGLTYNILAK